MRRIEGLGVSAISDAVMAQVREERGELIHPLDHRLRGWAVTPYVDHLVRDARSIAEGMHTDSWKHPTRRGTRARYDNGEVEYVLEQLEGLAGSETIQGESMRRSGLTTKAIARVKSKLLSEPH